MHTHTMTTGTTDNVGVQSDTAGCVKACLLYFDACICDVTEPCVMLSSHFSGRPTSKTARSFVWYIPVYGDVPLWNT